MGTYKNLNLSSVSEWSYAGTVTVVGDKADVPAPSPEATATPSPTLANPVLTSDSQSETPIMTATPAVQKPGKVAGLKLIAKKNGIQASWKKCKGAPFDMLFKKENLVNLVKKLTRLTRKTIM